METEVKRRCFSCSRYWMWHSFCLFPWERILCQIPVMWKHLSLQNLTFSIVSSNKEGRRPLDANLLSIFPRSTVKIYPHGSEFPQSAFLVKRYSESLRCAAPRVHSPFPMGEDLTTLLCLMLSSHHWTNSSTVLFAWRDTNISDNVKIIKITSISQLTKSRESLGKCVKCGDSWKPHGSCNPDLPVV